MTHEPLTNLSFAQGLLVQCEIARDEPRPVSADSRTSVP